MSPNSRQRFQPARADAVKVGRRSDLEAGTGVSRPHLDGGEHVGMLVAGVGAAGGEGAGSAAMFEPPAFVAGLDDVAVVREAVEQCCRHLGVAEHARPFAEGEVRGYDHR